MRTRSLAALACSIVALVWLASTPRGRAHDPTPLASAAGATSLKAKHGPLYARASEHDVLALAAARSIARRVRTFRAYRAEAPLGTWRMDALHVWQVRRADRCMADLRAARVPVRALARPLTTPVPAPVVLTGPVRGVSFRAAQADREVELSCELAARLPALADLLRRHDVRLVHVNSSYRDQPRVSFHTFGLALDVASFATSRGPLVVATDFEITQDVPTCAGKPLTQRGRALLALACDIAASGLFSSVITPNYNAGHRDHLHFDARPDDPRLFVR